MKESTIKNTLKGLFVLFADVKAETGLNLYQKENGTFILSLRIDHGTSSVEGKSPDEVIQKALDKWLK